MEGEHVAELWAAAIDAYELELDEDSHMRGRLAQLRDIASSDDLGEHIENWGGNFVDFRQRQPKLWTRIKIFINPLQVLLRTASDPIAQSSVGVPVSAIMGALVNILQACEKVSNSYDQVEEMFRQLHALTSRLAFYQGHTITKQMGGQIVVILHLVLKIFGRSEHLIRRKRSKHGLRTFFWGKDETTSQLLQDLEKSLVLLGSLIGDATYVNSQKTQEDIYQIKRHQERSKLTEIAARVQKLLIGETSAHKNVKHIFNRNKVDLISDTASWLRAEPLFQKWEKTQIQLLWLVGDAGLGKSFIATSLIKEFQTRRQGAERASERIPVAYFFMKEDDAELRDVNIVLKTLAWQLQSQDENYRKHIHGVIAEDPSLTDAEETWRILFLNYYCSDQTERPAIMILDGFDEADESRGTLLKLLAGKGRESTSSSLRFIIIGRKEMMHVEDSGQVSLDSNCLRLRIEVARSKSSMDIQRYVLERINNMWLFKQLRRIRGDQVAREAGSIWGKTIIRVARGVFLFAKLLLDQVEFAESMDAVKEALNKPPLGLHHMIGRLFSRLENDERVSRNKETIRLILLHTAYSRRTVLAGELDVLINATNGYTGMTLWYYLTKKLGSVFDLKLVEDAEEEGTEEELQHGQYEIPQHSLLELDFDTHEEMEDQVSDFDDLEFDLSKMQVADSKLSGLQQRAKTFSWEFDTVLTEAQIKTPLPFSHQLILEGIRKEGQQSGISLLPVAETAEIQMSLNCLKILRSTLPASLEWTFLAEYPLRNIAFHLKEAMTQEGLMTQHERRDLLEHLHWLFGTDRGAESLIRAIHGFDVTLLKVLDKPGDASNEGIKYYELWDHKAFWETWVATEENLRVVQKWLGTYEQASWLSHDRDRSVRSWCKIASSSYAELLRCLVKASATLWLERPGYGDATMIHDNPWEFCLTAGWITLIDSGTPTNLKHPHTRSLLQQFGPYGIEHIASSIGRPLSSMGHFFLGLFLSYNGKSSKSLHHFEKAVELDPENWRAQEFVAYAYTAEPSRNYYKAVAYQVMAHSLCGLLPEVAWLTSRGGLLDDHLISYVSAVGNDEVSIERVLDEILEAHSPKYHSRAVAHLIFHFPEFAVNLGSLSKRGSPTDVQLLADTIELLLLEKKGNQDALNQAQGLFEIGALLPYSSESDIFAHALDLISSTLTSSIKSDNYKGWSIAYKSRLYLDRVLSASAASDRLVKLSVLEKFSDSSLQGVHSTSTSFERLCALLPGVYLIHAYNKFSMSPRDSTQLRQAAAPWVTEQITTLEEPWKESKRSHQARLLTLARILDVLESKVANTLYAVLLGSASLACGLSAVADAKPEKGSIFFDVGDISPRCDGAGERCKPDVTVCTEMWSCQICLDRDWCERCLLEVRTEGDGKPCSPDHIFRQIWPISSEAQTEVLGWDGGKMWIKPDWWEQLKMRWKDDDVDILAQV